MIKPDKVQGELPSTKEIYRTAYEMAWPSTIESVLVGIVGLVDTVMVSSLGPGAIAAVGITNQPRLIVLSIIMSLNVGVTAVIARRKGEDNRRDANQVLRQCLILCASLSIVFGMLAFAFARPLLVFAGAGADIIADAVIYFKILMAGMIFNGLSLTINAAQRGAGNTRIAMRTNIAANVVNVVFNYLLINGHLGFPKLGVAGAAIATVLGTAVSFAMALFSLFHRDSFLDIRARGSWRFQPAALKSIFNISSSALVEQLFMRIGFFAYAKIVAGLGTIAFATHQICMNILSLSFTFGDGLAVACSALVGQNLGAKRPDLAMIYGKVGQRIALLISAFLSVVFFTLARPLMSLFTSDAGIIAAGVPLLYLTAVISYAQISNVVMTGCLRGAGDTRYVAIISMISIMIVRPGLSYLLCYPAGLGLLGAWIGVLIDQFLRISASLPRFYSGKWTKIKV